MKNALFYEKFSIKIFKVKNEEKIYTYQFFSQVLYILQVAFTREIPVQNRSNTTISIKNSTYWKCKHKLPSHKKINIHKCIAITLADKKSKDPSKY